MRIKLSERLLKAVALPVAGQRFLRDTEQPGLGVRLTPTRKTFILEARLHGRAQRLTLGPVGVLRVEEARQLARIKLGAAAKGEEIGGRLKRVTLGVLLDRYEVEWLPRKRSARDDRSLIRQYLAPWRNRPLGSITRAEVAALHAQVGPRAPYRANRLVALLRKLFNLGRTWGLVTGDNPATGIERFREEKRARFVTPEELPRLCRAIEAEPDPWVRAAVRMLLFTGARVGEVLRAEWPHVDLDRKVWMIPQTKAGRPHWVPLPTVLVSELAALPRLAGCPFVFPGPRGARRGLKQAWARIRERAALPDVRLHDLRRTVGSWLAAGGASLPVIGKVLNHSQPSTTAIYARLQLEAVREALEANASRMLGLVDGSGGSAQESVRVGLQHGQNPTPVESV